ncbi:MAG: pyruvate dehydrogenase (acetyl-transferring), homodimeric type, partial [Elusimicrobia bacterium]|nr:pyruvate dehydrogenase (acetyl-transferring), homodimeric type [Elusimicrobiota bacterium]
GEGLQHQDGHSHLLAYPVPNLLCYDPAFAFELAVIIREGLRRMYERREDVYYYITVMNENYPMPPMPDGVEEGILRGLYRFRASPRTELKLKAQLFGSGAIFNEALAAQSLLEGFEVAADVWSVTSYKELRRDALEAERWNLLHPEQEPRVPYLRRQLQGSGSVFVVASDYVRALPDAVSKWFPQPIVSLGTEGFGRSETREALRDFFEVDRRHIAWATLVALHRQHLVTGELLRKAAAELAIEPEKRSPLTS